MFYFKTITVTDGIIFTLSVTKNGQIYSAISIEGVVSFILCIACI